MARMLLSNEECGFIEEEDGTIRIEDLVVLPAKAPAISNDVPESRLMITELIIEDFKSYAGKQTLGPFNKNFTCIVGPNGSGKSNVIDSLLFVFGYKSKKIRSKKLSLLIHKSEKHPNLKSCSVTVNFAVIKDEGDSFSVLPDSRFVLSRKAFSDDTSYYEIMSRRVQYKDVTRTLKAYGIDLEHSRFLILQGEIEAISLMHTKAQNDHESGMLEYIEDIIGSNRLIAPINEFIEKVKVLNEEKNFKETELSLVETEKKTLEEPKNKAIQFLRLENQSSITQNSILLLKRKKNENDLRVLNETKKDLVIKMRDVKKVMDELSDSKNRNEQELNKVVKELDVSAMNLEKYKEEFRQQEKSDNSLLEELKYTKQKKEKLQESLTKLQNELNKLEKQATTYESETKELEIRKQKLEAEKEAEDKKATQVIGTLKSETNALKEKKDKLETELIKSKEIVNELKSQRNLMQSELSIQLSTGKKEEEKLADLKSDFEKNKVNAECEDKQLQHDKDYISRLENDLSTLKDELKTSKEQEELISQELKLKRVKLEEAKSSVNSTQSRNQMINAFRKEKAQGRLTGVYGRLGDLGAIDQKYDVAISTACGPLDNIVTDYLNTAQKCVEFLKRNNLGYATFIPLEKMSKWSMYVDKKIQTPENVPRLFDLITVNNKDILPAFYYALRDTLVAENLEQATRIGLQGRCRYRVVTLKGELIDLAGTMSGGGGRPMRGRMGQKIVESSTTEADVSKLNYELNTLMKNLADLKKKCSTLEAKIAAKTNELNAAQRATKKRKVNVTVYREAMEMLEPQIIEQEKKVQNVVVDHKKVKKLEAEIEQKNKEYLKAAEESSSIEKKVSSIQSEILKVTKEKSGKAHKNVEKLAKQLQELAQSVTKSAVNMKTSSRNIEKLKKKMSSSEKELEELSKTLLTLKTKRKDLEETAKETFERKTEAEEKLAELKEKLARLKEEINRIQGEQQQLKLKDNERKNEFKNLETDEADIKSAIKIINSKLLNLKLHEVEDDPTEIPILTDEELNKLSLKKLNDELELIKVQKEEIEEPNFSAIKEFKTKEEQYLVKLKEFEQICHTTNVGNSRLQALKNRRLTEFMKAFQIIANKLKEIYQMLTLGGDALIEPTDSSDPFSKGIDFSVRPPRKAWKSMRNLSGGEKTLSSLALVLALHYYRPTPFYVMDEIDAALDFRNVAIVAYYLKERTKNAQLIVISLRNSMNELSDQLLGIFKINNCTRFLNLANVAAWAKKDENDAVPN